MFRKATAGRNTFAELRSKLRKSDLAVEIIRTAVYEDHGKARVNYAALLIGKEYTAPKLIPLDSCAFFDTLFISHYKRSIEDTLKDVLSYSRFFKALSPYSRGISNIYFSADGVYQKLNLYTLYDPASGKYLLETATISQLNSLRDLTDPKAAPAATAEAALFGFPDYELKNAAEKNTASPELASRAVFSDIPELPGTKKETEAISALLTSYKRHISLYLGAQATEEQVKTLSSPAILHIATHGFFLPDEASEEDKILGFSTQQARQNPLLRSGLLMAGAAAKQSSLLKQDDGILTAYEASLLNLQNTDLVTLSACETGLGDLVNGQGVYGLQRAFLTAGARSVVMSLWVVDDDATQQLMTEFYKNYLGNTAAGEGKREALRKAQLAVRKQYPHPYHWGAFVLIGN
jgi:CHAT domain-containing protein